MNEAMKEITPLLEKLAAKLGTTAEHLWGVLIKQAYIEGISAVCLIALLTIVTAIWGFLIAPKLIKKWGIAKEKREYRWSEDGEWYLISTVIVSIIMLFLWLPVFMSLSTVISCLYNPEYWALNRVLQALGR